MLIPFDSLFEKYRLSFSGVLHIGANVGEEAPMYDRLGIKKQVWIEANPDIYHKLKSNLQHYPLAEAHNYCIGDDEKEVTFHVSNNGSQSSSVLELGTHKFAHPEVHYIQEIKMQMRRVDTLGLNLDGCDFLNIDLQGAELMALKGMGDLLHNFKAAYLEVNKEELYTGCALVQQLDLYLLGYGFKRVETKWCGNTGWGDALYLKRR